MLTYYTGNCCSLQLFKLKEKVFLGWNSWTEDSSGTYTIKPITCSEMLGLLIFILKPHSAALASLPFVRPSLLLEHDCSPSVPPSAMPQ